MKQMSEELYQDIVDMLEYRANVYPENHSKKKYAFAIMSESKKLLDRVNGEFWNSNARAV